MTPSPLRPGRQSPSFRGQSCSRGLKDCSPRSTARVVRKRLTALARIEALNSMLNAAMKQQAESPVAVPHPIYAKETAPGKERLAEGSIEITGGKHGYQAQHKPQASFAETQAPQHRVPENQRRLNVSGLDCRFGPGRGSRPPCRSSASGRSQSFRRAHASRACRLIRVHQWPDQRRKISTSGIPSPCGSRPERSAN